LGLTTWSTTPSGSGYDFESQVLALTATGKPLWWDRLHKGDSAQNNTASQFVDALEIDQTNNQLVVLGSSVNKCKDNFLAGNENF
jgi:hypothetical protein